LYILQLDKFLTNRIDLQKLQNMPKKATVEHQASEACDDTTL